MPDFAPVVHAIPVLKDNYTWLMETSPGNAILFDPGDFAPIAQALQRRNLKPTHICITHHHHDHIGGVTPLASHFNAQVVGHAADATRLPPLDQPVNNGDTISLGSWNLEVVATPGHTIGHVVYRAGDCLFTGDTLFSLGCGRLFEGTAEMMWSSLQKLRSLSGIQRIFPAHEYTLANLGFALKLEPNNSNLLSYQKRAFAQTDQGMPTLPTTMEQETLCNPFLRSDHPDFAKSIGLAGKKPVEVFAHVRSMRNTY